MRLPSKLLGCMRVGVGVGAVVLGGCDLVDEAKARVLGEEDAVAEHTVEAEPDADQAIEAAPAPEPASAPEPLLLGRAGVAGVVQDAVAQSNPTPVRTTTPAPVPPPIEDLGRPRAAPESAPGTSSAFIPYDDGAGTLASAPPSLIRPTATAKPLTRPKPRVTAPVDEPCVPGLGTPKNPPKTGWDCPACGRG